MFFAQHFGDDSNWSCFDLMRRGPAPIVIIPDEVALVAGARTQHLGNFGKISLVRRNRLNQLPTQTCRFLAYRDVNGMIHLTYAERCLPLVQLSKSRGR